MIQKRRLEDFIERIGKISFQNGLKSEIRKTIQGQQNKTLEISIDAAILEEFEVIKDKVDSINNIV